MGGGGTMRTAAKFFGIGSAAGGGGIRGILSAPPAEHSFRNASRPISASLTSSPPHKAAHTGAVLWDDDWDLASDNGELIMEAGEAMPRVVFGGAPSFQEAKAATFELKEAIDKVYLSSNSSELGDSSSSIKGFPFNSELEAQSHVLEAISITSVPKSAIQAFQMLSTNHDVQNVVASLACDSNVWNAVMQNSVVKEFLQSQQNVAGYEKEETSHEEVEDSVDSYSVCADFMLTMLNKVLSVAEMISNISSNLHRIFGSSTAGNSSPNGDGSVGENSMGYVPTGGTLMGLAVLVVMVVLLNRV